MTVNVNGPGSNFKTLFDEGPTTGASLPIAFQAIYDGDWRIPDPGDQPFVYTNFATARDGRVSYNEPGKSAGGDVTNYNAHDRWLMGLLRARAQCIVMGDATLKTEPEHIWTAEHVWPEDAAAFTALRKSEGLSPLPLMVFMSLDGDIDPGLAVFCDQAHEIVIATTHAGAARAEKMRCKAKLEVLTFDGPSVNSRELVTLLHARYGMHRILCEGGPRVMGGMLAHGVVSSEFVTLCPAILGRTPERPRPSYVEGHAFMPNTSPYSKPIALRRAGDFLYMQTRCEYKSAP
jgi:riboflavin biosynthesis pyrimidine reductase